MWFYQFAPSGTGKERVHFDSCEEIFVLDLCARVEDVLAAHLVEQRGLLYPNRFPWKCS